MIKGNNKIEKTDNIIIKYTTIISDWLSKNCFSDLPEHYSLRKKVGISLVNSTGGLIWQLLQTILILYSCSFQVTKVY